MPTASPRFIPSTATRAWLCTRLSALVLSLSVLFYEPSAGIVGLLRDGGSAGKLLAALVGREQRVVRHRVRRRRSRHEHDRVRGLLVQGSGRRFADHRGQG